MDYRLLHWKRTKGEELPNRFLGAINNWLDSSFGLRVQPSPNYRLSKSRMRIIKESEISLVLDIGANRGQWALNLLSSDYAGRIISFEPTEEFIELQRAASNYSNWDCHPLAISNSSGMQIMHQASNGNLSSSLLAPNQITLMGFDINFHEGKEVETITLDEFFSNDLSEKTYLKVDVQGAEMLVLEGASKVLDSIKAVEFESAIIKLYKNEHNHYELTQLLIGRGFKPRQLVVTHWNRDMDTVSLDAVFVRD